MKPTKGNLEDALVALQNDDWFWGKVVFPDYDATYTNQDHEATKLAQFLLAAAVPLVCQDVTHEARYLLDILQSKDRAIIELARQRAIGMCKGQQGVSTMVFLRCFSEHW